MAPPVTGYVAWYDADQITGVADGALLATWNDLAPTPHNLTQATSSKQPIYYTSYLNGMPAVVFNGVDDVMATASWTQAQPFTVCMVGQHSAHTQMPWNAGASVYYWDVSSGVWQISGGTSQSTTITATLGTLDVIQGVVNAAASQMNVNGTTQTVGATAGTTGIATAVQVGSYSTAADFWIGPICEILIYPSALNSTDQASIYTYLDAKWRPPPVQSEESKNSDAMDVMTAAMTSGGSFYG